MAGRIRGMFSKSKDKKTQKLGVNIPRIVKKFMSNPSNGFVEKTEYNNFWLAMDDDASDVNVYIHLLVQYLLAYMRKNNQTKIPFNAQVLLNTISFVVMRHPTDTPSKPVKEILSTWYKNKMKYDDQSLPAAKDVLGLLYKQRVEQNNALDSLIIQCYQFYSHEELSRIADYYSHPTIVHVVGGSANIGRSSGDKVCIWSYLKQLASHNPDNFRLVIQNIIKKLLSISGQILLLPKLAEISLLALIFMTRQLISYTRVPDEQWLDKSIANLRRFYLWPIPYGSQARDLLIKLQRERIAPGSALIQKIWRECRVPEILLTPFDQRIPSTPSVSSQQSPRSPPSQPEQHDIEYSYRPLYYLLDGDDAKSLLFADVMRIEAMDRGFSNGYKVHGGPSAYIAAMLMLNIISYDCGKSTELESAMRRLNENEIMQFYKQVMDIFLSSSSQGNDSKIARQSRVLGLQEITHAIITHANDKEMDEEEQEECILRQVQLDKDYHVGLPPMYHTALACDLKKKEFPSPGQMASNEMLYPSNEILARITNLLKQLQAQKEATPDEKESDKDTNQNGDIEVDDRVTLRFIIAGGNAVLSETATAYASLMRHAQPLLSNFQLDFFVVPYSKNHFSEWLARHDPWYNRHIYLPLACKLFVAPSLQSNAKCKLRSHGYVHTIGQFYREMTEAYAREADQLVQLKLWECLCWESPPYTKTPHQLIAFCQRVEIGAMADKKGQNDVYQYGYNAQVFRNRANTNYNNQEYKNGYDELDEDDDPQSYLANMNAESASMLSNMNQSSYNEYTNNGMDSNHMAQQSSAAADELVDEDGFDSFDYQPIALDIEWQPVDMLGRAQRQNTIEQKNQYMDALSVSSVPRYGDKGFPASPDKSGVIHMYCTIRDSNKKKKFQEYALLKSEPSQHVRTCTIQSSGHNDKFFVLVDDQIYGKFSRIKIQPMIDPLSKQQVHMPIRTFFPVNNV